MEKYCRTDLAPELFGQPQKLPDGVAYELDITPSGFRLERYHLSSEVMGRPRGDYVTLDCGRLWELDSEPFSELTAELSAELRSAVTRLTGAPISPELSVLVVGLGNRELTPDALGPGSVSLINATRHLAEADPELFESLGCCRLSAVAPGVLGQTGIETLSQVEGICRAVMPDVVIAIDAMAARSCDRLATTVQLGDGGIRPGSGVKNRRSALDRDSLGVPVLALGAPTVVDSATIVYDALCKAGIGELGEELRALLEGGQGFFVAPKEADAINDSLCRLFSGAVNLAFGINLAGGS